MSENMAYSHFTRPNEGRVGYVGHANMGVECRIGEGGEILVKSPAQMIGYYKEPPKTAESYTPDGFFKTGDMGELDEEGRIRITGRVKDLFKTSKGKYVAPVPIENRLATHPRIDAVCVAGMNRQAPFALIVLSDDTRKALTQGGSRDAVRAEIQALVAEVNAALDPSRTFGVRGSGGRRVDGREWPSHPHDQDSPQRHREAVRATSRTVVRARGASDLGRRRGPLINVTAGADDPGGARAAHARRQTTEWCS